MPAVPIKESLIYLANYGGFMRATITEQKARELSDGFVATQKLPSEYTLKFSSISKLEGKYYIRYNKVFKQPTKENPPYRLVIVEPEGRVHWGNP